MAEGIESAFADSGSFELSDAELWHDVMMTKVQSDAITNFLIILLFEKVNLAKNVKSGYENSHPYFQPVHRQNNIGR